MTRTRKYVVNVTAIVAALIVVAGFAFRSTAPAAVANAVNQHWVPADTFHAFRSHLDRQHIADTNTIRADLKDIRAVVFHVDSVLRCDHGRKNFCP